MRDPLYKKIRSGLAELKDGNAFELCVNDLLRKIYPSLAPREGGNDAGLDGLVAEENKNSIQLICTTGQDVIGNLSKSIKSNIQKGGTSPACIFATSQKLTNAEKRNLEKRSKELGRTLLQIFDQAAITNLLYRNSRWLKELLGITGDPPALSLFPVTSRPFFDVPAVGRDDDIARIAHSKKDGILVGQPGSGKTHVLYSAAKKGKGRFVVSEDMAAIANDLRDVEPKFVIVDDADSRLDFLKKLNHLRQEIGASFHIIASCWPGQENRVAAAIQANKQQFHFLDGLTTKQIKEVIQSQKIFGPEDLLREIIHQSQGKPGLAVTLCRLCWDAGTRDVVFGTALARDVQQSFESFLGHDAAYLLACFAIGGDAGMSVESVARLLNKSTFDVVRVVEQLAAAGILDAGQESRLLVQPLRLRQALVRDIFLKPPVKIDLTPFLVEVPDFAAATRILIEAKIMGGEVSDDLLRGRLLALAPYGEQSAYEEYAHLGETESDWILNNFPDKIKAVSASALRNNSEKAVLMLLDLAAKSQSEKADPNSFDKSDDALPEIKKWILGARPNSTEALERRRVLANALAKWVATNKNPRISIPAAKLVMSLKHESTSVPPGEPTTMNLHFAIVSQQHLKQIFLLWPIILPILKDADPAQGIDVADIFHAWIHPDFHARTPMPSYEQESRGYAKQMMSELLDSYAGQWTFHHHFWHYAEKLELLSRIQIDPIAAVLYPPRDFSNFENEQVRRRSDTEALVLQLYDKDPVVVANILSTIEEQARRANVSFPSWGRDVCWQIAELTDNLTGWTKALFERNAPAYLIEAFLEKMAAANLLEVEPWISLTLERPTLQALGVGLVLKHCAPEDTLFQKAKPLFKNNRFMIEGSVLRREVNNNNLRILLNHEESAVSSVVAANLWGYGENEGKIPSELFEDWKRVIAAEVDDHHEHILEKVFPRHPDVAYNWIVCRLEEIRDKGYGFYFGLRYDRALPAALNVLTQEQKIKLIDMLPDSSGVSGLAQGLVSDDPGIFRHLLTNEQCGHVRLSPLRIEKEIGKAWEEMAIMAMDNGFSELDVLGATEGGDGRSWSGPMSSMYASRAAPFEKLFTHSNPRLAKIGQLGRDHFIPLRDEALKKEKRAAIRGELC